MRPIRRRSATALLIAPLLSGCFASGGDPGSSDSSGSGGGKRLRVALAFPPTQNFSPHGQDALLLSRLGVAEGLTRLDANGAAAPALAESWSSEKGGRDWLFTLRDARFHDGAEVTPEAVADALTRAARATPPPAALTGVELTAEAVDGDRVRVSTGEADPVLPLRLSNPSLSVFSPKAYGRKGAVDPAGTATGPFELTEVTGDTAVRLDRFDDHWGGRAQAPGIDARFIADGTARANALRTGEVDIAESLPVAQLASLDADTVRAAATARNTGLHLNTSSGPFADPGLRAAAREAIDTSALAKGVYEGRAEPGRGVYGPALTWAAGKRKEPKGRAEPADPGGTDITLATYDNRPELPETAQVLQQQLEKAGFEVELEVRDYSRLESDALAGKFDAVVLSRNTMLDTGDPVAVLAADFTCEGGYNLSRLCDEKVDAAVARAQTTADPDRRRDAAMAAEAAVLGTDAVVPLAHLETVTGVGTPVRGVLLDPYERTLVGTGTRR
ncbi:ABC transporter substrate-binding protein [Streptomyces sp. TRM 70361]|uniref:ABC transporter substrate-binding protein n=1 Tax=Streptomyces sp. TRM 70361 TaxID=3116553 RepID=UPI002E7BD6A6|nr:ABC transporter substrate-binding protein [Streptomyces sp. TRM 70361]MEE1941045.1 ABC transporter substrate-binding protein [Streptomyces sp. TRM 70361]